MVPLSASIRLNGSNAAFLLEGFSEIETDKPVNFIALDATDAYEAIRERADVLTSVRNGDYLFLFKRAPRKNDIEIDFLAR